MNIVAYQADEFIRLAEETFVRRYGPVPERLIVDLPPGKEERPSYPLGTKVCSCCGAPSGRKVRLDGLNYYCKKPECRRAEYHHRYSDSQARTGGLPVVVLQ